MPDRPSPRPGAHLAPLVLAATLVAAPSIAQEGAPQGDAPITESVLAEVRQNILAQQAGAHPASALNMPPEFVDRLAHRELRASFEKQFRAVVPGPDDPPVTTASAWEYGTLPEVAAEGSIVVIRHEPGDSTLRARTDELGQPGNRAFRAAALQHAGDGWPFGIESLPGGVLRTTADRVSARLAFDGLLPTLARALDALGADDFALCDDRDLESLRAIGIPTDLLLHFDDVPADEAASAKRVVERIAKRIEAGEDPDSFAEELGEWPLRFRQTIPGYRVATESGEHEIDAIRMQLVRGDDWLAPGDGGSVDMLRGLVAALPDARFIVSIEPEFVDAFLPIARSWPLTRPGQLTLIVERLDKISQWAQDNAKSGFVGDGAVVSLAPRYASRNEAGAMFDPGDSYTLDGLERAGLRVLQSPLLFQGGDVLPIRDPATGETVLFVGEATVWRNLPLGLSREQVEDALRTEFGADRLVVLPAASFHIDIETSLRVVGGRLVAFMNDEAAATTMVLPAGVEALGESGRIGRDDAAFILQMLRVGDSEEAVRSIMNAVSPRGGYGRFSTDLANSFSKGPADSGVGNLHRFMLALDVYLHSTAPRSEIAPNSPLRAYLDSLSARDRDREAVRAALESLGAEIVPLPGISAGDRSITPVNMVHGAGVTLVPVWGGLYENLDEEAIGLIGAALGGDVRIAPIPSSETQRRSGGVHCAAQVIPRSRAGRPE